VSVEQIGGYYYGWVATLINVNEKYGLLATNKDVSFKKLSKKNTAKAQEGEAEASETEASESEAEASEAEASEQNTAKALAEGSAKVETVLK
jgi:hypothetical protein